MTYYYVPKLTEGVIHELQVQKDREKTIIVARSKRTDYCSCLRKDDPRLHATFSKAKAFLLCELDEKIDRHLLEIAQLRETRGEVANLTEAS